MIAAESGERALAMLADDDEVALLFADVVMPGMSGIELAHAVRLERPELPVVLATGYSDEILSGAGSGFEILRKPYDGYSLGAALIKAIKAAESVRSAPVSP